MQTVDQKSYRYHIWAILALGVPLIGGHVAQFAIGMTDTIMMGWYSIEGLAAVVLGSTFFFVVFILGGGFGIAVMPMVAEAKANEDEASVRRITRMGMWLSVIYAVAVLPLMWFAAPVLIAAGQEPALAQDAQTYLRIAGFGMMPALLLMVVKSYLAAQEHTRVVFWITVAAAVCNIGVNYVLIFGNFGAPELGIRGAAVASVVVQVVSFIGVMIYALRVFPNHSLLARVWKPDADVLRSVLVLGATIGITSLSEVGLFAGATTMMGWIGTIELAAHGIALQLAGLTFMVHLGLSNAATVRAGNALGRKDVDHLVRGAQMVIAMSVLFSVITVILFVSFPEALIGAFLDKSEPNRDVILATGVSLITMAALFQFVDGAQAIALGLLRGLQDTNTTMALAALSYWGIGIPAGYVLAFMGGMGAIGIWLGLVVGLSAAGVLLMWRFWRGKVPALRAKFAPA